MNNLDLIKTVRGLDQTGPGANGENLQRLWSLLTSIYDTGYHAAEETTLRWLLKSMNGPSPSAEIVRRYPLTWTILACVVQRIPLFSLAKSLADRKFIAVLQQTLKDISKPTTAHGSPASPKRKRHPTVGYDLTDLQARHGCLETAREVFKTLQTLLARLEINGTDFTRDKIGAEHIKSRFGTSAAEATRIAAPALAVCAMLASDSSDNPEGSESWIATVSTIWDLHLQAADDAIEVATHLFTPSATILARIGSFPTDFQVETPEPLKGRWRADLEAFMHRNLIFPGKATFMGNRTFEAFDRALEISKSIIQLSASALYFLSAGGSNRIAKGEMRKDTVEWLKQMFKAVELMIRERPDRSILMQRILEQAIQQSKPVDVDDLRRPLATPTSSSWVKTESI
ncbi:hypothetical protein CDD83_8429 [Cordyceps sp. RAO-2017]|nr:hypothetical protein CDD83_8429 [Cordyceps sp. RAO-2017]